MQKNNCNRKHIILPKEFEWKCPKCGANEEYFYIDCDFGDENGCDLDHPNDIAYCQKCDKGWTLKLLLNNFIKKQNFVKCPHCKGTGYIKENKNV